MKLVFTVLFLSLFVSCSRREETYVDPGIPGSLAAFDRVVDSLRDVTRSRPEDMDTFNRLGLMYYHEAKWMYEMMKYRVDFQMRRVRGNIEVITEEAMRAFDTALRLRPTASIVYSNKAMVCVLKNKWEEDEELYMRNCRDALSFLRRADSLSPGSSEIWYRMGVVLSKWPARRREAEAARCFDKALELDKENARAAAGLAELQAWKGEIEDTQFLDLFRCVAAAKKKDAELRRNQSDLYDWAFWAAERAYWKSLRNIPAFTKPMILIGLRLFGNPDLSVKTREDIARSGLATADDYYDLIDFSSSEQHTRQTLHYFNTLLAMSKYPVEFASFWGGLPRDFHTFLMNAAKLEPSSAWVSFYAGKNGGAEESRSILLKSIDLDPGNQLTYYLVGVWYYQQKDYDNAITWLKQAVDRKPADEFAAINAHQLMTLIHLNKGEIQEAIDEFEKSVKLDSLFAVTNIQRTLLGREDRIPFCPEKPISQLTVSRQEDRRVASLLNAWGAWSREPAMLTPSSYYSYTWNRKATYHFNDKQSQFLKSAIELDPDNEEAHLRLATYYVFSTRQRVDLNIQTGEFETSTPVSRIDESIGLLESYLRGHPSSRKAHLLLGHYFAQTKRFEKAAGEFRLAARLGSAQALDELERLESRE
jgi:tetratricopeptide (TPR) repeat protein